MTSFRVFVAAFALLLGSVVAVGLAQVQASSLAAWASLGLSAAAGVFTVAAVVMRS
jgi:hypothetical protein